MEAKIYGTTGTKKDGLLSTEQQRALDRRQSQCVKRVQDYWGTQNGSGLYPEIAMPTGFGKGRVVHRLLKSSKHDQILTIVGSKNILLDQSQDVLAGLAMDDTGESDFSILPDLSGRTVLATWQGLTSFSRKHTKRPGFGLGVIDEVHNIGTRSRTELLKWLKPEHVVGLTATSHRASGEFRAPEDYGFTVVDSMPLPECIDKRWLSPLLGVCVDTQVMLPAAVRSKGPLNQRLVSRALRQHPHLFNDIANDIADRFLPSGMKTVIVVNRVNEEACVIAKELMDRGYKVGLAVNQKAAKELCDRFITLDAIRRYKLPHDHPESIQVLISPQVIGEGFDAPATECVIWACPTMSHVRYTQVIGRGSRRCWMKKYCLIVDYVYMIENYGYSLNFAQFFKKEDLQELDNGLMYVGPENEASSLEIPLSFFLGKGKVLVKDLFHLGFLFRYSEDRLINELKALRDELGRIPMSADLENASRAGKCASATTYSTHFGSHNLALKAAGMIEEAVKYSFAGNKKTGSRLGYGEQELIQQLQALHMKLKRVPTRKEISEHSKTGECASCATFQNFFGSFTEAFRIAGLVKDDNPQKSVVKALDKQELLIHLKKLSSKLGRKPNKRDLAKEKRQNKAFPSYGSFREAFGSLEKTFQAAGY
jgi:superfamily II DNA or RNA helicase